MSAANRSVAAGTAHVRPEGDVFETPAWATRAILQCVSTAGRVLEPSAGRGAIVRELLAARVAPAQLHACELNEAFGVGLNELGVFVHLGNFLDSDEIEGFDASFDLVIGNPPYRDAEAHVRRALACRRPGGTVAMLLRLGFLASSGRAEFHREHPCDVLVLDRRPSFVNDGRTDAADYAWCVWAPGRGGRWSVLDTRDLRAVKGGAT